MQRPNGLPMNQSVGLLSSLQRTNSSETKLLRNWPTVIQEEKLKGKKKLTQVEHSQVQHEPLLHV